MDIHRKFPRLNLSCDLEYVIAADSFSHEAITENSKTKDISAGGMCFITYHKLPVGTVLQLKFKLGKNTIPVQVKGRITWSENFNIGGTNGWDNGLEFIDMPENDRQKINEYLNTLL